MGILDEAIKEHLELKRQHGAAENELQQLEDEAFGAAERPGDAEPRADAAAEAPTEFMSQPDLQQPSEAEEAPEASQGAAAEAGEAGGRPSPRTEIADLQEGPAASEPAVEPEPPAEEEAPAMEHEAVPEAEIPSGPTTEEREAIAEQPTEMYDVEEELGGDAEAEAGEGEVEAEEEYEEDDDFWDEKRLSDELDQALEAPAEEEVEDEEAPYEDAVTEAEKDEQPGEEGSSGDSEDVLEETPDFLEEAPEDDQLWFEQKPPKDFNFDD
ncbi:MAG TPA: hypothetical protein VH703_04565 [Solirubrobacterales bacterium]|jgi:hypothetical protein